MNNTSLSLCFGDQDKKWATHATEEKQANVVVSDYKKNGKTLDDLKDEVILYLFKTTKCSREHIEKQMLRVDGSWKNSN